MSRKKISKRDFDEQFEAFLKDSVSSEDSFDSARINKFLEAPKREPKPWWDDDEDNEGLGTGTGKSFLKSRKSVEEEKPKPKNSNSRQKVQAAPKPKARKDAKIRVMAESSISKDSLDDISEKSEEDHHHDRGPRVHVPNESMDSVDTNELLNMSPQKVGMDTLDELADKEKFFRDLENQANGTLDYRRMNQELSVTANTMSPEGAAKTAATLAALQDIEDEEERMNQYRGAAPLPADHLLSEREASEQKPSMLSKVSLMDSLESTMNTTTSPQVGKGTLRDAGILEQDEPDDNVRYGQSISMKTGGTGMMGTNTSQEIEALHRALKEVGLSATIGNDSQIDVSSQGDKADKGTADLVQKLLNSSMAKTGKQRNFAEIMAELEQIQKKQDEEAGRMADRPIPAQRKSPRSPKSLERQRQIVEYEEFRGFDLSPAHPLPVDQDYSQNALSHRGDHSQSLRGEQSQSHRGGFETSHTEDTEMYLPVTQVTEDSFLQSVTERSRSKKKKDKKSDRTKGDKTLEQTRTDQTGKVKVTRDSKVRRSRSDSPRKSEKSGKTKYDKVKSYGYGNLSPHRPHRDMSRDKDFISMNISKATKTLKDNKRSPAPSPSKGDVEYRSPPSKVPKSTVDVWSPAEIAKQKIKGTQSPQQARKGVSGTMKATQLQASIESFTQYIKDHFGSKTKCLPEMKYSVDEPTVSTSFKEKAEEKNGADVGEKDEIIAKLRGDLESLERSYERRLEAQKLEYEEQIHQLKQENFVLNSQLSGEGQNEAKKKLLAGEPMEGVSKEQITQLEREMKEQETLIAGYQQENKRLYNELKNVQKQHKQTEERMFKENQKLLAEASNLRTQLEQKEEAYKNKGIITGHAAQQQIAAGNTAGAITTLENELQDAKRTTDALNREMLIVQQSKVELEKHIEKLVREREEQNRKIEESKTMKSEEARALEAKYEEELEKLRRKLKWYAENQEILDKSARQLRNKDDEIHKYKMRIEELQTESGKRVEDSKVRARERAADAKKIQDLQRQVKEMEQILKRRNPNSLPTLMMAAAAAPDSNQQGNRSAYTEVLEKRVKKLEAELEQKDGEADTRLRGVEQKYNSVKLQYEERIKDLELQLSIYQGQMDHVHPHTHAVALERELESVRERYKQQIKDLTAEVDRLTNEASKSKKVHEATFRVETQSAKETETELRALVKSLQLDLDNKTHDLQVMQKSLERLRKEKQMSMTFRAGDGKKTKQKGKSKQEVEDPEFHSLPVQPSANEKEYEPKDFESTHITDVVQENEELKMKVDHLQLQLDQQRVDLQKSLAETEAIMRRNREDYEENLESLRANHQKEVQRILAQQALEHSASRLAELQSKLDTQEVVIKHLREQQARLEVEAEAASVLRIKQTRLEETLKSLNNDLKEAKKSHSPEMRHFEALQEKITQIENKHSQREQELQQIIRNTRQNTNIEIEREVTKWKNLVETKNNEIQKFRMELDSILEVLRVLQKQGVVIPVGSAGVS